MKKRFALVDTKQEEEEFNCSSSSQLPRKGRRKKDPNCEMLLQVLVEVLITSWKGLLFFERGKEKEGDET